VHFGFPANTAKTRQDNDKMIYLTQLSFT